MTRATASIHIYAEDESLRNEIDSKISNIINSEEKESHLEEYNYDVFIAYHGTRNPNGTYENAKKLCDELTKNGLRVFLNGYSCNEGDEDLGFSSTTRIIQKSKMMVLVINDNAPVDGNGMLKEKNDDGSLNQLNQELKTMNDLINTSRRTHKTGFRFLYCGSLTSADEIYNYLNVFYHELSYGFECCFTDNSDIVRWAIDNKDNML